ncbi:hypothetical protein ASG35_12385 [Burkholderia sp. Leaf177]|uniref:LysR substrate-binding domain-containing protein n=1 Tax=Burkholderia sp. Leaf177 TaxID=1736287 RepID=UPI0006F2BB52|nr:LysR substrate-binding domain-containing protein [Burkholderia sp. Leaf177]KQR77060.1 hypothetical protein ASG35_12385 [Burkholderia sp. Leaf177]
MGMNLRQIEAFKAVMETGTVTQAAARLHIAQPSATKLLQMCERSVGMPLFTREGGRLTPTAEAHLLYEEVERVFQGAERINQAVAEIRALRRGTLSIGMMPGMAFGFAQEVLSRLESAHPGIKTQLHSRETTKLVEQLAMQQIELLYTSRSIDHADLRVERICRVPLVCILPKGHELGQKKEIRLADLRNERLACFTLGTQLRGLTDLAFERAKVSRVIALESMTAPPICAFVARGLGVAIVNPLHIGMCAPLLSIRPLVPTLNEEIVMASPRSRKLSRLAEAFADESRKLGSQIEADPMCIASSYA